VSLDGLLEQLSGSGLVAFAHAHPGGAAVCGVSQQKERPDHHKDPAQRGEMTHLSQTTSKAGFNRRAASRRDLAAGMLLRPSSNRATLGREEVGTDELKKEKKRGGRQSVRE
jgi:hypothetical protein